MKRFSQENWAELSPLLDEALELGADQRAAWLAEQRISHPTLATELEALLELELRLDRDGFLGERQAPELPPVSSLAGQRLGAYLLERPLGQGGMGSVWLARRDDGRFEGVAAIKFLSLGVSGPAGEARFRREGNVLARLTHPNIARLLDAGVTPAGQPYLVLEHVDGKPLDRWCDERRLPVEARLRLFQQVLAAVAHAHANFIVHRDLKPANILVTADGTVKLLDFGIAKLLEESDPTRATLTGSHEAVLTFEYAAPEQIRGDPITTATDVYSLGVVLYQLLAGRHPTSADCNTPAEHVVAILDTYPGQLSRAVSPSAALSREGALALASARDASPERLRRIFAGDLDNILAKALKKTPAERYPTVRDLDEDLGRYLAHEPVSARPDAWSYRTGKFLRRHRGSVGGAVVVALALIGAAVTTALQAREARRQRDDAVRETLRADGVMQFQRQLISQVGEHPMTMRQIVDRGVTLLDRRNGGDPASEAEVVWSLSGIYDELGDRTTARRLLARAESLAVAARQIDLLLQIQCRTATELTEMGLVDSSGLKLATYDRVSAAGTRLDARTTAICLDARATRLSHLDHADSSVVIWQRARKLLEAEGLTRSSAYLTVMGRLGSELTNQNRLREAIAVQRRVVAAQDSFGESGTYRQLVRLQALSFSLLAAGEVADAERFSEQAAMQLDMAPSPDYAVAISTNRAIVTFLMGWPDSSLVWFTRAAQLSPQLQSRSRERRALFGEGRAEVALDRLGDARRTLAQIQNLRDSGVVSREELHLLGWLRRAEGNLPAADSALTQVLRQDGYFEEKSNPGTRAVLVVAADVALKSGDMARALKLAGDARRLAMIDSLAESRSMYVGEARLIESRGLFAGGDTARAITTLTLALPALRTGAGATHPLTQAAESLLAALRR